MDLSAPHSGFTVLAYILSALALSGIAVVVLIRQRRLRRHMARAGSADEAGEEP